MSRLLLDTHVLLWSWHAPQRIPPPILKAITNDSARFVSIATLWEIAVKVSIGKLQTVSDPFQSALETGCKILPIERHHVDQVANLPLHHRDPFDRMLIANKSERDLTLLTVDHRFSSYDVKLV